MDYQDIIVIVVYILLLTLLMISYKMYKYKKKDLEKAKHEIESLKKNLDDALHCPNTVSFNSYECEPITLYCRTDVPIEATLTKKELIEHLGAFFAQELAKCPEYVKLHEQTDIMTNSKQYLMEIRVLPWKG